MTTNNTTQPRTVTAFDFWSAYKPLFDLLGITPVDVYDAGPIHVARIPDGDGLEVRFLKVVAADQPAEDWPLVEVGDDPDTSELAYDVRIPIEGVIPMAALWPETRYPSATRAFPGMV